MALASALIEAAQGRFTKLIADRGYDGHAIRTATAKAVIDFAKGTDKIETVGGSIGATVLGV